MRVLHIQKATGISGSERHLLTLLPALRESGVTVRVCLLGAGDVALLADAFRAKAVDVHVVPAGPDLNPMAIQRLRREIRSFKPHIVHTHLIHADLHGQIAARLEHCVGVTSEHGSHPKLARQPYRTAARTAAHFSRVIIAISHHVAAWLAQYRIAAANRVRVVHYGIDAGNWELSADRRVEERRALCVGPHDVVVGVASRLVPFKGHDVLIEALAALDDYPNVRLLVAGDGPLRTVLEQRAAALPIGRVRFLGFVADIPEFMNACDLMAFPTQPGFGEGFGLAALEAMAAGRPVIASEIDSLPEIVKHGSTGLLVPPGDVAGWTSAIARLAGDYATAEAFGRAGRRRAVSDFSLDAMARSTIAVYEEALS
ncbi:MAG TPA: glycosyltransferase family 4 protein [Ilumatobacter sp.]|nr:glycosyltransferase family 4 protein [Ilumatobacter sp.]